MTLLGPAALEGHSTPQDFCLECIKITLLFNGRIKTLLSKSIASFISSMFLSRQPPFVRSDENIDQSIYV